MKLYILSLAVGLLVGVIYGLLQVRSPAPPIVALVGLLGILVGEQLVPIAKKLIAREAVHISWLRDEARSHMLAHMPSRHSPRAEAPAKSDDHSA